MFPNDINIITAAKGAAVYKIHTSHPHINFIREDIQYIIAKNNQLIEVEPRRMQSLHLPTVGNLDDSGGDVNTQADGRNLWVTGEY